MTTSITNPPAGAASDAELAWGDAQLDRTQERIEAIRHGFDELRHEAARFRTGAGHG